MIPFYILLIGFAVNCIFVGMAIESNNSWSCAIHFILSTIFCSGIIASFRILS